MEDKLVLLRTASSKENKVRFICGSASTFYFQGLNIPGIKLQI